MTDTTKLESNLHHLLIDEEKFDGFYAVVTNLDAEDNAKEIIRINSQRYRIED